MRRRFLKWFIASAGAILVVTGLAIILCGCGHSRVLILTDPIFNVRLRLLMVIAGSGEFVLGACCFSRMIGSWVKSCLIASTTTALLVYRAGVWGVGWHHPCHCMGSIAGTIHLADQSADKIMKAQLFYLLVGSYLALFQQWHDNRARSLSGSLDLGT